MEISNEILTVRALTILRHLKINNLNQLKLANLPVIGTVVFYSPLLQIKIKYTQKVDDEIKDLIQKL